MKEIHSSETSVLKGPHGVTSQKAVFYSIVVVVVGCSFHLAPFKVQIRDNSRIYRFKCS
jgi:hypothetical protein